MQTFAEPRSLLQGACTARPATTPLPPRWRSLAVVTRTDELDRLDGSKDGMADALIALASDAHRVELNDALADGVPLAEVTAAAGDQVVWDGLRVVAILRPLADGTLDIALFPETGRLDQIGGESC